MVLIISLSTQIIRRCFKPTMSFFQCSADSVLESTHVGCFQVLCGECTITGQYIIDAELLVAEDIRAGVTSLFFGNCKSTASWQDWFSKNTLQVRHAALSGWCASHLPWKRVALWDELAIPVWRCCHAHNLLTMCAPGALCASSEDWRKPLADLEFCTNCLACEWQSWLLLDRKLRDLNTLQLVSPLDSCLQWTWRLR